MSATTMPGFTPANAMTSAGFSRCVALAVGRGAFRAGDRLFDGRGIRREWRQRRASSRQLEQCGFHEVLLGAHYAKAGAVAGTTSIAPVTHPGEPTPIPWGPPCVTHSDLWPFVILLTASWTAFGAGSGSMPQRSAGRHRATTTPATPEETARLAYNAGVRGVEKGDELDR